jgi:hypothetical protein
MGDCLKGEKMRYFICTVMFLTSLFMGSNTNAAGISDTGQEECYNDSLSIACPSSGQEFFGQDFQNKGNYGLISRSFSKMDENGNILPDDAGTWAMVRDNVTGLVWEVKTDDESIHDKDNKYHWYNVQTDFITVLKNMNEGAGFGGFGGNNDSMSWRLPSRAELLSIAHYQTYVSGMAENFFLNIHPGEGDYYMSGDEKNNSSNLWVVLFGSGTDQYDNMSKTTSRYVIAVRGVPMDYPILQDNGNGTITDTRNGLTWTQNGTASSLVWKDALAYVADLNQQAFAGKSDWRLPNVKELVSVIDLRNNNPAVDAVFNVQPKLHWSSSTDVRIPGNAYTLDMDNGLVFPADKDATFVSEGETLAAAYAIAVRGGQAGTFAVKGDMNADGLVNLADAIISLKICAGLENTGFSSPFSLADISVSGNSVIGIPEAIYSLQGTAGLIR